MFTHAILLTQTQRMGMSCWVPERDSRGMHAASGIVGCPMRRWGMLPTLHQHVG